MTIFFRHIFQVSWIRREDIHILTMNSIVYTTDTRFSATRHATADTPKGGDTWALSLIDAKPQDSGFYECQLNTVPKKSKSFELRVVGELRNYTLSLWAVFK